MKTIIKKSVKTTIIFLKRQGPIVGKWLATEIINKGAKELKIITKKKFNEWKKNNINVANNKGVKKWKKRKMKKLKDCI